MRLPMKTAAMIKATNTGIIQIRRFFLGRAGTGWSGMRSPEYMRRLPTLNCLTLGVFHCRHRKIVDFGHFRTSWQELHSPRTGEIQPTTRFSHVLASSPRITARQVPGARDHGEPRSRSRSGSNRPCLRSQLPTQAPPIHRQPCTETANDVGTQIKIPRLPLLGTGESQSNLVLKTSDAGRGARSVHGSVQCRCP